MGCELVKHDWLGVKEQGDHKRIPVDLEAEQERTLRGFFDEDQWRCLCARVKE